MAFGQPPGEVKAAEEAQRKAIEIAENRKMSPFERKLIGVLEDIRDRITPAERVGAELDGVIGIAYTRADAEAAMREAVGLPEPPAGRRVSDGLDPRADSTEGRDSSPEDGAAGGSQTT